MPDRSPTLKLAILGRDGTLNDDRERYITSAAEWVALPGALEATARLHQAGWHVVVATNQSGLGRGLFDMAVLNEMHLKLNEQLARRGGRLDAVFFCPHSPEEDCDCRKPRAGLYTQIGQRYSVDLAGVPVISNKRVDLQAALSVGCTPHLVRTGLAAALDDAAVAALAAELPGLVVHTDLAACVEALLSAERRRAQEARQEGRHESRH